MKNLTRDTRTIFRDLADAIDHLGEREVQKILRAAVAAKQVGQPAPDQRKAKGSRAIKPDRTDLIRSMLGRLKELNSRDEARSALVSAEFSRREIETLARSLDIPARKDIKVADLIDLIVNMTVGGRLNSRAIRGED